VRARSLALRALAVAGRDLEAASMAENALGFAATEMGDLAVAMKHLGRAARIAERAGHPHRAAEARRNLIWVLVEMGDLQRALAEAERVAASLPTGIELARVLSARGMVLERLGRMEECLESYAQALAMLRRARARGIEGRVLCNRGTSPSAISRQPKPIWLERRP